MSVETGLKGLAERWSAAKPAERANFQSYIIELCEALGVERPRPAGSGYEFELPIQVVNSDGTTTTRFADLFRRGHFLLEAKDEEAGKSTDLLLRRAFGQASQYAAFAPGGPPPYLMVLDVGTTLIVWDRWGGAYGGFQAGRRIDLRTLASRPDDIAFLVDIWTSPHARDPRRKSTAVTRDIAGHLAKLATALEARGHDPQKVARFLMRAVFTMFAEDVGLLPDEPFRGAVELGIEDPAEFAAAVTELWRAMDEGRRFGLKKLLRFNGHFFHDQEALPLEREDLAVLLEAARADWRDVEPTIFGTLLTRALDPVERHRLGAEYTPREFVERLVRPTIEEPVRERWTLVQAEVLQLRESARKKDRETALARLRAFHDWLRSLRVLDPACGSGNFLYVSLAVLKSVELEVLREIEAITGHPEAVLEEVGPWQFHGIEIKPWAREIAELTLWIGYHQWWRRTHGHTQPPEPVLKDTGTLECRDAILAWESVREDPARARPDPTPRITSPVTGQLVPDPEAKLPYLVHEGARPVEWPRADFIVGNPPYMGNKRMREAFGDGYVDALRAAYPEVPESADYVMYWWHRAAEEVAAGRTIRAGLITTNSITQTYNRAVVERAMEKGVGVAWAIPTHPWADEAGSAAVRVAMTVLQREAAAAVRVEVDDDGVVVRSVVAERLNADLSVHADVVTAAKVPLKANAQLSSRGFTLVGRGFVLDATEAEKLVALDSAHRALVRPYRNGRDLAKRPRGVYVIDFGLADAREAERAPVLLEIVRSRVKPQRDANQRAAYRDFWWRFGEPRVTLREALNGLPRYIVTPYVSKHRFFTLLDARVAPDEKLVCIASDQAFILGVLSSSIHVEWALAAGSRLGVGNDLTYNNSLCFDSFPFPDPPAALRAAIAEVAERLDRHRKEALARDKQVTITGMYNIVEKLRREEPLTQDEREVNTLAACGVLRDVHDELDRLVAQAYGWDWPLAREEVLEHLVALHDARVAEEARGVVRWLRPEYQKMRVANGAGGSSGELALDAADNQTGGPVARLPWPHDVFEQLRALRELIAHEPCSPDEAAQRFTGARRADVSAHLEALTVLGVVRRGDDGRYRATTTPALSVAA